MRYAVLGFGRSGSHWVSDLLVRISGLPLINDDIAAWKTQKSVLHSNDVDKVLCSDLPDDSLVVFCIRNCSFDAIISLEVAKHTNEWYHYSGTDFQPFYIDPEQFVKIVKGHYYSQLNSVKLAEYNKIPYCVCIYEELLGSTDRYRYVADTARFTESIDHRDVPENPNPRDYRKIVSNYEELKTICGEHYVRR